MASWSLVRRVEDRVLDDYIWHGYRISGSDRSLAIGRSYDGDASRLGIARSTHPRLRLCPIRRPIRPPTQTSSAHTASGLRVPPPRGHTIDAAFHGGWGLIASVRRQGRPTRAQNGSEHRLLLRHSSGAKGGSLHSFSEASPDRQACLGSRSNSSRGESVLMWTKWGVRGHEFQ
jgi:hypothetical protein